MKTIATFLLTTLVLASAIAQVPNKTALTAAQKAAIDAGNEYMQQCREARKGRKLDLAEIRCRAAIQVLEQNGFHAQGETAMLGMILYEKGVKREGYKLLRDSYATFGEYIDRDIYLGRVALELKDPEIAKTVVAFYTQHPSLAGARASSARGFWPQGEGKVLQATLDLIEGSRLCDNSPTPQEGLDLLRRANRLCPGNVAINFSLGKSLIGINNKEALPCLRLVAEKGSGTIQKIARQWLPRLSG